MQSLGNANSWKKLHSQNESGGEDDCLDMEKTCEHNKRMEDAKICVSELIGKVCEILGLSDKKKN